MTAPAKPWSGPPAPSVVPGVASLAIRETVLGPSRSGTVLGVSTHAVWLELERDVVVLSSNDAVRLPNAVEVALPSNALGLWRIGRDATAIVGDGRLELNGVGADVVRWWDPRPALPPTSRDATSVSIAGLPDRVPGVPSEALRLAITQRRSDALLAAAAGLLGRGPGLTPEADDYLSGAIAAVRCLGPALGAHRAASMLAAAAAPLAALATARTTLLSAALLRHALAGSVAAPAGALLRAVAGRGEVAPAHARLCGAGHSSGPALAAGLVLAAAALIDGLGR